MKTYIALLRGINVSGQKKIKMADLKLHLEELNFNDIQTYIQSGNIVFKTGAVPLNELALKIENKISKKYGFHVPVIIKTPKELINILNNNPFADKDLNRLYFTFLSEKPSPEALKKLNEIDYSPEEFKLIGQDIYFYAPLGYGRAKMNNNFFENKLNVKATTRNWKTVNKLIEMAQ